MDNMVMVVIKILNNIESIIGPEFYKLIANCQDEAELYGRTIRVNIAKPMKIKEGYSRAGMVSLFLL